MVSFLNHTPTFCAFSWYTNFMNKRTLLPVLFAALQMAAFSQAHAFSFKEFIAHKVQDSVKHKVETQASQPSAMAAAGSFEACRDQFPKGIPLDASRFDASLKVRALCFDSFAVLHSGKTRTPLVSVERLNAARLQDAKDEKRTNKFFEDARLPSNERATLNDYVGSNMDRGHMAPAADMPNANAMAQSFSLANMVPQNSVNNQKIWNRLESDVRKYASRASGNTYVFTGPLFRVNAGELKNRVLIPSHLFKLVYNEPSGKVMAYIVENSATARVEAPMNYSQFVQETNMPLLDTIGMR